MLNKQDLVVILRAFQTVRLLNLNPEPKDRVPAGDIPAVSWGLPVGAKEPQLAKLRSLGFKRVSVINIREAQLGLGIEFTKFGGLVTNINRPA